MVASLAGPARGTLTGSEPVALADGRLTVAVNPVLLPSADRFGEQVGAAVAATCAVRVVPSFVAAARGGGTADDPPAAAPSPEPDPMPERELVARLADTLNATEVSE